jgi:hypothetical protein
MSRARVFLAVLSCLCLLTGSALSSSSYLRTWQTESTFADGVQHRSRRDRPKWLLRLGDSIFQSY